MSEAAQEEDLGHPDSAIRLASAVHRFKVPKMNAERKVSFARSFDTCGRNEKTRRTVLKVRCGRVWCDVIICLL